MKMKSRNRIGLALIMVTAVMVSAMELRAQDWTQWRGPNREGLYKATGLNLNWSEKKPSLLWVFRQAGAGYSAPTIVGNTLYCQGGAGGDDFAFALDTQTGNLKWRQVLGPEYVQADNRGNGPRGSITIDGDKLYLIRGGGQIHCLSAADGKMLWQKDFVKDFGGSLMTQWGFSESPLVDGNLVICTPGGAQGAVVTLDKNSGAVVWRAKDLADQCTYSSPIVADVDGIRQYILLTLKGVAGVAAKDGKLLWQVDVPGFRTAVIPTPLFHDGMVYVTAGYNVGCLLIKLSRKGDNIEAETIYANKNMVNQHGGVVLVNGHIYGATDGLGWVCQDWTNGEIIWRERNADIPKGALLAVNDRLLLQDERTGLLVVVAATPDGWREFGRMQIPERTEIQTNENMVWTHPVIANGKLYLRDHNLLFCFDL